ncbi:MAG TPA: branched-chain amino acid ABC transporter ATP-binding protein/permease [Candidatus Methylomirabilis sp.]|nr:branched-chain amino acid ABC transporter ATP-binding protein/permease [Candidatus Methylomirabilis sp.]
MRLLIGTGVLAVAILLCLGGNGYQAYLLGLVGVTALVGTGLNVLMGLTGQTSIGHVGFFAIGAYTTAILTKDAGASFWLSLAVAGALAAIVGGALALPALRLSGPYLAMITLAFAFVIEHGAIEWRGLTGGASGIMGIPPVSVAGAPLDARLLAAAIAMITAAGAALFWLMSRSAWGYSMRAVRDAETAAAGLGLHTIRIRWTAFVVSAAYAGVAGGLFTPLTGFVSPEAFPLITSIIFVLVVMAGGQGTVAGPLVGAAIVVLLPETLSFLAEYRLLLFGALLYAVLMIAPRGVVGAYAARFGRSTLTLVPERGRLDLAEFLGTAAGPHASAARGNLVVEGLTRGFGGVRAVCGVGLTAQRGAITSVIGPNGAGKTTLLNLISGVIRPEGGGVRLGDRDLSALPAHSVARAGIARTYQTPQLFAGTSVLDNVLVGLQRGRIGSPVRPRRAVGSADIAVAAALLDFVGYAGSLDASAGALAHVDRRLLEIARALATRPTALLLDEPAAGLSAEDTRRVGTLLRAIAAHGVAVLLVEHDMDLVMDVSSHVIVLDAGLVIAEGSPGVVQADPAVRAAYLGEGRPAARARPTGWTRSREVVLNVNGLVAGYGGAPVLPGVDLAVHDGEMVSVLGANGAGKSTLMAALSGLLRTEGGRVQLFGADVTLLDAPDRVRAGLVLVPEGRLVFPDLSVRDNLRLGAFLRRDGEIAADVAAMLDRFPRLRERVATRAGLLSGGEQQVLALARGLMGRPRVMLLDEPSLGLAPQLVEQVFDELAVLRDSGSSLLFVDQNALLSLTVADRGYVLDRGRVAAQGSAADLLNDDALLEAYLGGARPALVPTTATVREVPAS